MRTRLASTTALGLRPWLAALVLAPFAVTGAFAQTAPAPATPAPATPAPAAAPAAAPATPAPPAAWVDGIKFDAQFEGGISINTASPSNGENFGQLYTDHSNTFQLNQAMVTVQRATDPKSEYDVGFALQALYGTDGRYLHYVGVWDRSYDTTYQPALIQANVAVHTPWLFASGIDFKVGMYPTPIGYEVIDPSQNQFYSHSYIYNFGVPTLATGGYMVAHVNGMIDIYLGVDSGVNTSLGPYSGDNNSSYSGMGGFNLTLLGGNLTILALTHFGPENPGNTVPLANRYNRYIADSVITWKATDKLTLTGELDYIHDDNPFIGQPTAYGGSAYASYALTDTLTLNGRFEVFDDENGFFVTAFPGNNDFAVSQGGYAPPNTTYGTGKGTTYSELTLGVTYKPAGLPAPISALLIRPEIRYDTTLNGVKAFNGPSTTGAGKDTGVLTLAADFVLTF
ncbi:MAG TPA: outer membrane beta-barrel protein [Acetobacteraceae bacterium]|jgi:hypothetical protein|nr:outer membrane beta-barrel protein [Acetobacteraceae bacterium]